MQSSIPWYARLPVLGNLGFPITQKELFAQVRRPRWFMIQMGYLVVLAVTLSITILSMGESEFVDQVPRVVPGLFMGFQMGLILLIFPLLGAVSITSEKAEKAFDLLIISDLSPAELVIGKLTALAGTSLYFLLTTMPLLATTILFGGISLSGILVDYMLLFLFSILLSAFGIFCSSFSKSTIQALISTYLLVLPVGIPILFWYSFLQIETGMNFLAGLASLPPGVLGMIAPPVISAYLFLLGGLICGSVFMLSPREGLRGLIPRIFLIPLVLTVGWYFSSFSGLMFSGGFVNRWDFVGIVTVTCVWASILNLIPLALSASAVETPLTAVHGSLHRRWWVKGLYPLLSGGIRGFLLAALLWGGSCAFFANLLAPHLGFGAESAGTETVIGFVTLSFAWGLSSIALSWVLSVLSIRGVLNVLLVLGLWGLLAIWFLVQAFSSDVHDHGNMYWLVAANLTDRFNELESREPLKVVIASRNIHLLVTVCLVAAGVVIARLRNMPLLRLERNDWPTAAFEPPHQRVEDPTEEPKEGDEDPSIDVPIAKEETS